MIIGTRNRNAGHTFKGPANTDDPHLAKGWHGDIVTSQPALSKRVRFWFEDLRRILEVRCGAEDWFWVAAAWASVQEVHDAPRENMKMVLGLHEAFVKGAVIGNLTASRGAETAIPYLKRKMPMAPTAYVLDFTDVLLCKSTRTCMGGDPRFGRPVPIDIWAFRHMGYIDPEYLDNLRKRFGSDATKEIKLDTNQTGKISEAQYEWISQRYNALVLTFNKTKFLGNSDWLSHQVMAMGSFRIKQDMDIAFVLPENLVGRSQGETVAGSERSSVEEFLLEQNDAVRKVRQSTPVREVRCWLCKEPLFLTDTNRGTQVKCPKCKTKQTLPK